jgi:hypothetical protein
MAHLGETRIGRKEVSFIILQPAILRRWEAQPQSSILGVGEGGSLAQRTFIGRERRETRKGKLHAAWGLCHPGCVPPISSGQKRTVQWTWSSCSYFLFCLKLLSYKLNLSDLQNSRLWESVNNFYQLFWIMGCYLAVNIFFTIQVKRK